MLISEIRVQRYRSIYDEQLKCPRLTTLIGRNGAGKSAFIQALRLFMDTAASPSEEDYYNRNAKEQILVEVTFGELNAEEKAEFASYLQADTLVVQRRFPGGEYYGRVVGCQDFEPIRERLRQKAKVGDVVPVLKALVDSGGYPGLRAVGKSIEDELDRWEHENAAQCKPYFRAGLFQGPTNIAGGKLRNRSQFVYVPPVREADTDATGTGRQSALTSLVAPLVKAIMDQNPGVKTARDTLDTGYGDYKVAVESAPEKGTLEKDLTTLLQRYDSETAAQIQLTLEEKLSLPPVTPKVWLVEDDFRGEVARKGHGLQRLFIFSILELYEKFRGGTIGEGAAGTMVLAIEEPELYQHPARARALASILSELSTPNEKRSFQFQVFLTTHSPYFVGIDNFLSVRRIEKVASPAGPMQTKVRSTDLASVGNDVLAALGKPTDATELSSWARLKSILGLRASEGFFADGVILVEGAEDEAVIDALARVRGVSLDASGIAIIPSGGKTMLPNLHALYNGLGIRVFTIFDADCNMVSDNDAKTEFNIALLKMIGVAPTPRPPSCVYAAGAVWNSTFLDAVKAGFSEKEWDDAFKAAREEFSISADQAQKKFAVIWRATETLLLKGLKSDPLEDVWSALMKHFSLKTARAE
jgi:putative ATP-dependent endonuclease of the OLD family